MTPTTEGQATPGALGKKPRLAIAIATACGVGYLPKAPGTFGSLVGVATAFLSSVFFLQPASVRALFSLHPDYETVLRNELFPLPGTNVHNADRERRLTQELKIRNLWSSMKSLGST